MLTCHVYTLAEKVRWRQRSHWCSRGRQQLWWGDVLEKVRGDGARNMTILPCKSALCISCRLSSESNVTREKVGTESSVALSHHHPLTLILSTYASLLPDKKQTNSRTSQASPAPLKQQQQHCVWLAPSGVSKLHGLNRILLCCRILPPSQLWPTPHQKQSVVEGEPANCACCSYQAEERPCLISEL